jgi:hypothetical protein
VPALKLNGKAIAESLVLIELVNDLYPEAKWVSCIKRGCWHKDVCVYAMYD